MTNSFHLVIDLGGPRPNSSGLVSISRVPRFKNPPFGVFRKEFNHRRPLGLLYSVHASRTGHRALLDLKGKWPTYLVVNPESGRLVFGVYSSIRKNKGENVGILVNFRGRKMAEKSVIRPTSIA